MCHRCATRSGWRFDLRAEDPKRLAERILARPARLELEWTDKDGRKMRFVPEDDERIMAIDEILT